MESPLPELRAQHKRYWDFSFHELGIFDQPALWKLVMEKTGADRISYICHSQGFAQMYVSMMAYPEFYKKHMRVLVGIAPVAHVRNCSSKLLRKAAVSQSAANFLKGLCPDVLGEPGAFNDFLKHIHANSSFTQNFPTQIIAENYPESVNPLAVINFGGVYPAGGSFKQIDHFRQLMVTGELKMYDYDFSTGSKAQKDKVKERRRNFKIYG
mmetsp:Transcript_10513/g.17619  ORF Transcript_10513/g.17619 Transcript_10513/m.17619 type:complete len:211 (-) Transcript_10513:359-991(-)